MNFGACGDCLHEAATRWQLCRATSVGCRENGKSEDLLDLPVVIDAPALAVEPKEGSSGCDGDGYADECLGDRVIVKQVEVGCDDRRFSNHEQSSTCPKQRTFEVFDVGGESR